MKKVLVFELNNYHTETFPIYQNLLPALLGDEVAIEYYVMGQRYADTAAIYDKVHQLCPTWLFPIIRHLQLRVPYFLYRINGIIRDKSPDLVVFNSVEPKRYYRVFKMITAPRKLGLVHNPKKSMITKEANEQYFVLSRILFENFKKQLPLSGYLLPYFGQFKLPEKAIGETVTIAVQGLISYKRRDYHFLLDVAKTMQERGIKGICFNIIGSRHIQDGPDFFKSVEAQGLAAYFHFYDELDDRAFAEEINASDCIMTLLHENQRQYYHDKTTASLSHAASYGKPLVLCRENAEAWNMDSADALIYDSVESFIDLMATSGLLEAIAKNHMEKVAELIQENIRILSENHE